MLTKNMHIICVDMHVSASASTSLSPVGPSGFGGRVRRGHGDKGVGCQMGCQRTAANNWSWDRDNLTLQRRPQPPEARLVSWSVGWFR
jgi:hypothetical protein